MDQQDIKTAGLERTPTADGYAVSSEADAARDRRVLRKLDLHLAPLFIVLYFVAYLDRSNIGNAAVVGLNEDLGLSDSQYSTAVSVFFATYVAFEIPVVLGMKKLQPQRAISLMCLGWATVTIGSAFVRNFGQLVAVRLLLGLCEAGFFPCLSLYVTMVYKREEQVRQVPWSSCSDPHADRCTKNQPGSSHRLPVCLGLPRRDVWRSDRHGYHEDREQPWAPGLEVSGRPHPRGIAQADRHNPPQLAVYHRGLHLDPGCCLGLLRSSS